jgi:hypothetical protein
MRRLWIGSLIFAAALVLGQSAKATAAAIDAKIFTGVDGGPAGEPYSGFVGDVFASDIQFATDTGYSWHPFGLGGFGADITGNITVSAAGPYTFALNSDDGSELFIDGGLVINNGGAHGPLIKPGTVALSAGEHSVEVRFFECCGGASGVDLDLPAGVTFVEPIPEPASMMLLGSGLFALAGSRRRRNQK